MKQLIGALSLLILCVTSSAEQEDDIEMFDIDVGLPATDFRALVEGYLQSYDLIGVQVTVYVGFENYAFAQNACSWAAAQNEQVFTAHMLGASEWSCGVVLSINDVRSDQLEKSFGVVSHLVESFLGSAEDWYLIGRTKSPAERAGR